MKFVYKGKLKDIKDLPESNLPPNAVKFVEPEGEAELNKKASLFLIPAIIYIIIMCFISQVWGAANNMFHGLWTLPALVFPYLFIPIHEILHGVCFPAGVEVSFYHSQSLFVTYTHAPVSKMRFIFLSLFPNVILGLIPLIVWAIVPMQDVLATFLFLFGATHVTFGIGDYLNVTNAVKQMPKGSMQQLSGFNSYWFMPENS